MKPLTPRMRIFFIWLSVSQRMNSDAQYRGQFALAVRLVVNFNLQYAQHFSIAAQRDAALRTHIQAAWIAVRKALRRQRAARYLDRLAIYRGGRARVGRRHRTDEIMNVLGTVVPVDDAVLGFSAAEIAPLA